MRLPVPLACLALLVAPPALAAEPLPVLATTGMIADIAAAVGGECTRVTTLIAPGLDPHLYRATPSDLAAFQEAGVILYSGLNLEGQLGEVLARLGATRPVLAVAETIPEAERLTGEGGMADPHLWMDPALWAQIAAPVAATLGEVRPDCAAGMEARAAEVAARLAALDAWVAASVATIPEGARQLVTAHDAFAYYARAYGLSEVAIQGLSTEAEAGIADVEAVAEVVARTGVPAVFVETTVNPRTIEAMLEAVAARGGAARIGGELYSDSMGPEGTPAGSYVGMIRHNTETLVTALGGTPAPLPPELAP
jgi:manganese/zinc/iron transport system substrate-binding protein